MRLLQAARLSRLGDASTGLDKQDAAAQRYANAYNHEIIATAADTDVSGNTRPFDRPRLGPWLTNPALTAQYDGIIASHLDRLGRSVRHLAELHSWAEESDKTLITVEPNINWSSDIGKLIWNIMAWLAEQELKAITRRSVETQLYLKDNGFLVGLPPFGFQKIAVPGSGKSGRPEDDHKTLVPDPELTPVVREMVARALQGDSLSSICKWLDDSGIKPPSGKGLWATQSVGKILRNESLIGRRTDSDGKTVLRFDGIINTQTFDSLIQILNKKGTRRGTTNSDTAMLTGIIRCRACGRVMYRTKSIGGGGVYYYYRCTGTNRNPSRCRNMIPVSDIESWINAFFTDATADKIERLEKIVISGNNHQDEIYQIERDIKELDLDDPEFDKKMSSLRAEREHLKEQPSEPDRIEMQPTGESMRTYWLRLTASERRALMIEFDMRISATRTYFELLIDEQVIVQFHAETGVQDRNSLGSEFWELTPHRSSGRL